MIVKTGITKDEKSAEALLGTVSIVFLFVSYLLFTTSFVYTQAEAKSFQPRPTGVYILNDK